VQVENIKPGDKIRIKYPNTQGGNVDGDRMRTVKGVVVGVYKYYVRIHNGIYGESFLWWDLWKYGRKGAKD